MLKDTTNKLTLVFIVQEKAPILYFIINFKARYISILKKIAPDKWKHFFVGIPLGALLQLASVYFFPTHLLFATVGSFIVLLAGCYAFELFSLITGKGHYELWDVVAGVIGGLIGIGVILLVTNF